MICTFACILGLLGSSLALQTTPVTVGTYTADLGEAGFFRDVVRQRTGADPTESRSGAAILAALVQATGDGNCVRTWMHAQHAWAHDSRYARGHGGGLGSGMDGGGTGMYGTDPGDIDRGNGGRTVQDLRDAVTGQQIRFCRPCRIYLYGCRIADYGTFAAELAAITGCDVYAASGGCSTQRPRGVAGTSRDPWRADGGWFVYTSTTGTAGVVVTGTGTTQVTVTRTALPRTPTGPYLTPGTGW